MVSAEAKLGQPNRSRMAREEKRKAETEITRE